MQGRYNPAELINCCDYYGHNYCTCFCKHYGKINQNSIQERVGKRKLIAPKDDKRHIKRDAKGRISESDDQGRSLSQDRKKQAKTTVKPGYGDRGDQPKKAAAKKKS